MKFDYIIVQAGGKGTRLKALTRNKPKAIVSIGNLPMIYHLFRQYPEKKFIVIGDYKKDVLDRYLEAFPEVKVLTVDASGNTGTCAGINSALDIIPPNERFMLIWSDLVLDKHIDFPSEGNYVGLSENFPCRWRYENGKFEEISSIETGVAGFFLFDDKDVLEGLPDDGEFVRWLSSSNIKFKTFGLGDTAEYGLIERIKPMESGKCRPFNSMKVVDGKLVKEGIDEQGRSLAVREKAWYKHVSSYGVPIPKIYSYEPLTLELIDGKNIFEYDMTHEQKSKVLRSMVDGLKAIHTHDRTYPDRYSIKKAYYTKTLDRLSKVRNLIPFADQPFITVNGRKCRNVFFHLDEFRDRISKIGCSEFCLIHGDCTFSNMMLRHGTEPVFIDPRGYFGDCELVGDPNYDWAKLYYSLCGNYDQFNLGRFELRMSEDSVELDIRSNGWEDMVPEYERMLSGVTDINSLKFIHAIIWLSLTTYAWNDYDSICGAFYNGLYYLEEVL